MAALYLKLSDLCGQLLDAVFVLPRQIIHFLYGVVDLLYAGAHLVQAARADGKIVFYRLKTLDCPPPVFAGGKNRQDQNRVQNWKLAAVPFYPKGAFSRRPRTFLLASLPYGKLERPVRCFSICTEQIPAGCFDITVKEIPAEQLARSDREMGA